MLHLAQVEKKELLGKTGLRLLAGQNSEDTWALVSEEQVILAAEAVSFNEGVLVLVDISSTREICSIEQATDWVVDLVQQYLAKSRTPTFLQQEAELVENWRHALTLQSHELARRTVELEARREQIQELEDKLRREKKLVELLSAKLQAQTNSSP